MEKRWLDCQMNILTSPSIYHIRKFMIQEIIIRVNMYEKLKYDLAVWLPQV